MKTFHIEIIKPSHYDKDGYVIQWWKAWIPSNSMACLYAIALDCADRQVLGEDVSIEVDAFDEMNAKVPIERIAARIRQPGHDGVVCLVGVQSNQFPRAMAIARRFRAHGVAVAIGGFHVSGVLAMLKDLTPELKEAVDLGITLFAGEAEEHFASFLADVEAKSAQPIYNYVDDLPNLQKQTIPDLPFRLLKSYEGAISSFDAGRGCPFQCSFCTIINVQGRKSRWRDADDIERILRQNASKGVSRFFITDDNFARNRNWEAIFDRMIRLNQREGLRFHFLIQVDTLAHKIPNFIDKAMRAGCRYVFIGPESINPDNLAQMKKGQNRITEYRRMFQAWKQAGAVTYAGFILGLAGDTPATIRRDIEIVQRELPVDLLEFTLLTPLPGSEDHKRLYEQGVWMEPDLNAYDLESVTVAHPLMSREEWRRVYADAWNWYYTDEHVERLMRRNKAYGAKTVESGGAWRRFTARRILRDCTRSSAAISAARSAPSADPNCPASRRCASTRRTSQRRWSSTRDLSPTVSRRTEFESASRRIRCRSSTRTWRSPPSSTPKANRWRCSVSALRREPRSKRRAVRPATGPPAKSRRRRRADCRWRANEKSRLGEAALEMAAIAGRTQRE